MNIRLSITVVLVLFAMSAAGDPREAGRPPSRRKAGATALFPLSRLVISWILPLAADHIDMHSSMDSTEPKSAVHYWLDLSAGLAYITVGVRFNAFRHFLDAIDTLIANPAWQPGTPVLEDLRECDWTPPSPAIEEWRAYVAKRQPMLNGCRWAVVIRGSNPAVAAILDTAADDAAPGGVLLKKFTSTIDAHLWLKLPASGPKA